MNEGLGLLATKSWAWATAGASSSSAPSAHAPSINRS